MLVGADGVDGDDAAAWVRHVWLRPLHTPPAAVQAASALALGSVDVDVLGKEDGDIEDRNCWGPTACGQTGIRISQLSCNKSVFAFKRFNRYSMYKCQHLKPKMQTIKRGC